MKVKKIFNASLLCATLGLSSLAQATPFTFEFTTPAWSNGGADGFNSTLLGTNGVLSVTVDNGKSTEVGQSYLSSQITEISLKAIGGTYLHTWSASMGFSDTSDNPAYVSTDTNGIATFDLLSSLGSYGFYDTSSGDKLAFRIGRFAFNLTGAEGSDSGAYITDGFTAESTVPEPTSLALFGLALAGLALVRQRRQA